MPRIVGEFSFGRQRGGIADGEAPSAVGPAGPLVAPEPGAPVAMRAVSSDGHLTVQFDGVLSNRHLLTGQLRDRGRTLSTGTDAEIALTWFELEGTNMFDRLDGAFALSIWDRRAEELFIVRDRAGQMPLYYHQDSQCVRYSSDLRQIVDAIDGSLPMCIEALDAYLQLTYIPAPWTIYEGVMKLLPGTYLRVGADGATEPQAYWDIDYSESNQVRDFDLCKKLLREAVFNSVEDALATSDHAGALLSGGIDSTIITGVASKISGRPIDTFTIRFNDRHYDESARAQLSADLHRTNHQVITLDYDDVLPQLDSLLMNLDEPYADSSYIPASMVSQAASRHVSTVLTGDAGDELFAGYSKYLIGRYAGAFNRVPRWVTTPGVRVANLLLPAQTPLRRKINKVAASARLSPFEQRERLMSLGFQADELRTLLGRPSGEATRSVVQGYYDTHAGNTDEMRRALYLDFKVVLEGDMFPKGRYAGRPSGLRTTIPLLGRDVIEIAARIPSEFKIRNGTTKAILKDAFADVIPPALLKAPKSGFSMPLGAWLRGELRPRLESALSEEAVRDLGLLDYREVRRLKDEHQRGSADHGSKLWALYVLQKWQGAFL